MEKIGVLAGMGTVVGEHVQFRRSQAGLLDVLLASQPEAKFDEQFGRMRDELRGFQGVGAVAQPKGFVGKLRDYQREGLGWMEFLRRFSFGGCLADDMGVGKTAQVLAMLEARRGKHGPTLVVVPRSLIFNWKEEAGRFTPKMRVYDYTGLNRLAVDFSAYDLVLTTYGTLRRDALRLKDVEFDYVVLDEAQAVKNSSTESAKAVRLLKSAHRLALSGTPVENHLGELWSLFEFLNPGMLGAASVFQMTHGAGQGLDEESRKLLAQALRPFILRRTKDQVVKELPAKTEQTIYCELEPEQRKLYNELREHYRGALLKRIETEGMGKAKIMVLEALLRLRQAACHPGLIDLKRSTEPSAKLDALLEQLREVLETGHKALVFSQFTSMLKILRSRLDQDGIVYEYLDGKTKDRQACVDRFQTDAGCKLFLISLKAGGLGLNLTEAEYVFLLDPWWNPAVEAQAVDRAHRIGQKKAVFAYRLIARDTVEEKVLELQKSKKDLAAAIVGEDNALIRNLKREDLELLLS
jgi:SNF2 family DNA or RNA helicase